MANFAIGLTGTYEAETPSSTSTGTIEPASRDRVGSGGRTKDVRGVDWKLLGADPCCGNVGLSGHRSMVDVRGSILRAATLPSAYCRRSICKRSPAMHAPARRTAAPASPAAPRRREALCGETRSVHSKLLQDALTDFAKDASEALTAEVAAGAEIPFELESSPSRDGRGKRSGASLCIYRPLAERFVKERSSLLISLPSHDPAVRALEAFDGLELYLAAHDASPPRRSIGLRARASEALLLFASEVFEGQSDFRLREERLDAALARVSAAAGPEAGFLTVVATLHGVAIVSPEIALAEGLAIARPEALSDVPEDALWGDPWAAERSRDEAERASSAAAGSGPDRLIIALRVKQGEDGVGGALMRARGILQRLLRALRLFGDGRIALGPLAWACSGEGPFRPFALGFAGRPHGMLLVRPDQEDELRAFCSLIARRQPRNGALVWALRRYELGCERASEYEGLTDHLLALRALLEPQRASDGLLSGRVAALCAPPEMRRQAAERVLEALALERAVLAGEAVRRAADFELCREIASHLSALVRDVICGYLKGDLAALADELLLSGEGHALPAFEAAVARPAPPPVSAARAGGSVDQVGGDPREGVEVLDVLIEMGDEDGLFLAEGA